MHFVHVLRRSAVVPAVFALLCVCSTAHAAAFDLFLKLDGIPGDSKNAQYKDAIDVVSYSLGAESPAAMARAAAASGRATFTPLTFVHKVDKASPLLFQAAAKGNHLKSAELAVVAAGKGAQVILKITLGDVLVTSVQQSGAADELTESVALSYRTITIAYTEVGPDGRAKGAVKMSWDVATQK
jgi:type VI secretion system secreted protein Hcp